jgi:hypothetical protein
MPSGLAGAGPLPVSAGLRQEWHAQAQARPLRAGVLALAWNAPEAADRAPLSQVVFRNSDNKRALGKADAPPTSVRACCALSHTPPELCPQVRSSNSWTRSDNAALSHVLCAVCCCCCCGRPADECLVPTASRSGARAGGLPDAMPAMSEVVNLATQEGDKRTLAQACRLLGVLVAGRRPLPVHSIPCCRARSRALCIFRASVLVSLHACETYSKVTRYGVTGDEKNCGMAAQDANLVANLRACLLDGQDEVRVRVCACVCARGRACSTHATLFVQSGRTTRPCWSNLTVVPILTLPPSPLALSVPRAAPPRSCSLRQVSGQAGKVSKARTKERERRMYVCLVGAGWGGSACACGGC